MLTNQATKALIDGLTEQLVELGRRRISEVVAAARVLEAAGLDRQPPP
jgi:hypothetical protein